MRNAEAREPPRRRGRPLGLNLIWGLLTLRLQGGDFRVSVIWGLLDLRIGLNGIALDVIWGLVHFTTGGLPSIGDLERGAKRLGRLGRPGHLRTAAPEGPETMAQAQRETIRRSLGQGQKDIQDLSATIAHELRNPITAAKSLVQQMGEDPTSGENVEYASVALAELERVERSISHLLRFARDEQIDRRAINVADCIESAVEAMKDRSKSASVELEVDTDGPGQILGDDEKVRRVLLNLIGNAIDALEDSARGRIWIQSGENLARTEIWVRVKDNGPGIESERLDQIWSPFHTSKETGTGLGLSICSKIIEGHDGTIDCTSIPGRGAEFVITLPKLEAA